MSARERHADKKAKKKAERLRRQTQARQATEAQRGPQLDWSGGQSRAPSRTEESYLLERCLRTMDWAWRRDGGHSQPDLDAFDPAEWQEQHGEMLDESPSERAQDLAFEAMESEDQDQARDLAREALVIDPDCTDAAGVLFDWEDPTDAACAALAALHERYGQRPEVADALADEDGQAWNRVRARPYLRLLYDLALDAGRAGNFSTALSRIERLRRLAARCYEPLRVRHLGWLLGAGEVAAARTLIESQPEEDGVSWCWCGVLERFLAGDLAGARLAATKAEQSGQASLYEIDEETLPPMSSAEDLLLQDLALPAWQAHPEAMVFLRAGCRLTTPAQREAAKASYTAPVAHLLALGQPQPRGASAESFLQHMGLGLPDLPELLRLADDQAIHELVQDDPATFGPLHALNAIALLRPVAAVSTLVAMLPVRVHDEWMAYLLPYTLGQIGDAAFEPIKVLLLNQSLSIDLRVLASDTLVAIAMNHPQTRTPIIAVLADALREHVQQSRRLNACLASALSDLSARKARTLVKEAFDADSLDPEVCPHWQDLDEGLTAR